MTHFFKNRVAAMLIGLAIMLGSIAFACVTESMVEAFEYGPFWIGYAIAYVAALSFIHGLKKTWNNEGY